MRCAVGLGILSVLLACGPGVLGAASQSLAAYEQAAELNPDSPEAQFNLGIMSLKAGDDARAAKALNKATSLAPKDAEAWEAYGSALSGLGRVSRAVGALKRSTDLDPKRAGAWLKLAQVLAQDASRDSLGQAVEACGHAAALRPNDARPLLDEGLFLARMNRDAQAVSVLRKAARRDGGQAAYKALCVLYNKSGDYAAAEDACRRAAQGGGGAESWYDLGFALERRGKDIQARGAYDQAVALDPAHAAALYALAFLDFQAGDADKALQGFQAALAARHGDYPEAEYNVAVLLGDAGRYEQAAELYRGLLEKHPHDSDARGNLEAVVQAGLSGLLAQGQAAYERGETAAARRFWDRARHLDPGNGEAGRMLRLLDAHAASARARAARQAARAAKAEVARRLRVQDAGVRRKGLQAFEQGHWRDAERLLSFYLRNHPKDGDLRRTLTEARGREQAAVDELLRQAAAVLAAGKRTDAAGFAALALKEDPGNARALGIRSQAGRPAPPPTSTVDPGRLRALYYHGVEQYLGGNLEGAVDTWTQVLQLQPDYLDAQRSLVRAQLELRALHRLAGAEN